MWVTLVPKAKKCYGPIFFHQSPARWAKRHNTLGIMASNPNSHSCESHVHMPSASESFASVTRARRFAWSRLATSASSIGPIPPASATNPHTHALSHTAGALTLTNFGTWLETRGWCSLGASSHFAFSATLRQGHQGHGHELWLLAVASSWTKWAKPLREVALQASKQS